MGEGGGVDRERSDEEQRLAATLLAAYRLILEAGSRAKEAATPETLAKDVEVAASSASAVLPDAHTEEG
jgi:hypothetical protein